MSFSVLQAAVDAVLPISLPGTTVNGMTLNSTRFAIDVTDEPGTAFEDRYEVFVTGEFSFSGTDLVLSKITGGGLVQIDAFGDPDLDTEVSFNFRSGAFLDWGAFDVTDPETLLTSPLAEGESFEGLTKGISARATNFQDWLSGTEFADVFRMFGGDDIVEAGGGNDRILAGSGNDIVLAGGGRDTVMGGNGSDLIFTDGGADFVDGGRGRDAILLGSGDDTGYGGAGADLLLGQSGDDDLWGEAGRDLLVGGGGANKLNGGEGNDGLIAGGTGKDYLNGGAGRDVLVAGGDLTDMIGGADADVFVFAPNGDDAVFVTIQDFEDGVDRIALTRSQMRVVVEALEDPDSTVITEFGTVVTRGGTNAHEADGFEFVRITIGNDQLTLAGIADHDLDRSDFILTSAGAVEGALDDSGWDTELDPFLFF